MSTRSFNSYALQSSSSMERNLLERMVNERDEKITVLQKTINIQKEHTMKMQSELDATRMMMKQEATKGKLEMEAVVFERDLAQNQLNELEIEREKYKEVTFESLNEDKSTNKNSSPKPARTESSHALFLQSQLYRAMHSISALQIQTNSIKENCDAVVKSLQDDLDEMAGEKNMLEVQLKSKLSKMAREKDLQEKLLEERIRVRDSHLKKLERKNRILEGVDGSSSSSEEEEEEYTKPPQRGLNQNKEFEDEIHSNSNSKNPLKKSNGHVGHEKVESLLDELEEFSEHTYKGKWNTEEKC